MRRATAVILQIIARPDCGVSFVKRQFLRTELATKKATLPGEIAFDHRPHFTREFAITGPKQMTKERINRDQVRYRIEKFGLKTGS